MNILPSGAGERESSEKGSGLTLGVLLSLAGLISGVITACLAYEMDQLLLGAPFGLIISVFLAMGGILQGFWKAMRILGLTLAAYFISVLVAVAVQLALSPLLPESQHWSMGHTMTDSPIAWFFGGAIGAFLILYGIVAFVHPSIERRQPRAGLLSWSLTGGALGVLGWTLGPSLGVVLWHSTHNLGFTAPSSSPQDILYGYGEASRLFSLYVVWQTGMGLLLGLLLGRYQRRYRSKGVNPT